MRISFWSAAVLSAVLATGCVTRAKHTSVTNKLRGELDTCNSDKEALRKQSAADLATKQAELDKLRETKQQELDELTDQYEEMKADYAKSLQASKEEIDELQRHRAKIEKSLEQFRKLQEAFQNMIGAGEIRIYRRHGRIMVALPSSVLFPSGKADLSRPGKIALAKVSQVLAKLPDRRFLVAGHTDNVPISTAKFQDNWELSTARAATVTRFLVSNGVPPKSLAAAGYGEYDPLTSNDTEEGRQRNRRIEIVLMPNIDELPGIPDTPQ